MIPKAFRDSCECGRRLFVAVGMKVFCECGLIYEFKDGDHKELITTGHSNPALALCAIARYTKEQTEVLSIVRLHPRNTETIVWGVEIVHGNYITEGDVVNILIELQGLGAVSIAFTLGNLTYWVLNTR